MQLAEKPVHLPTELPLQPWEPPDHQVEWETEDGNSAGTDGTCREQGRDRCSHAQVSASEPSVTDTQPLCLESQQDHPMEMVRAVYFAEDEGADKERREEGTYFQRSPTPLQRKRRRTPVARGGGGARAGGGVPSTALFRPAASGGVSCAGQHSHQSVHEHAHDREHQHGRAATKPCDDFAVAAVTAVHEQVARWFALTECSWKAPCLYNISSDPEERVDLAPAQPGLVVSLKSRLSRHVYSDFYYWRNRSRFGINKTPTKNKTAFCRAAFKNGGFLMPWEGKRY